MQDGFNVFGSFIALATYWLLLSGIFFLLLTIGRIFVGGHSNKKFNFLALPVGLTLVYGTSLILFKLNLGEALPYVFWSLFGLGLLRSTLAFQNTSFANLYGTRLNFFGLFKDLLLTAVASGVGVSIVFLAIFLGEGSLPVPTSFDTSSGDMYFYLNFAEHIKSVGWDSTINQKYDSTPFDNGLERPSSFGWDHVGTGLVLISLFSKILSLEVWQIGEVVLLVCWLSLVSASIFLISAFTKLSQKTAALISLLFFANFAYLSLIGWWALNQIVFSSLFLLSILCIIRASTPNSDHVKFIHWLAASFCTVLAIETYPAVAAYSLVPIFIFCFLVDIVRSSKIQRGSLVYFALSITPFSFLLLGTGQFIPRIFQDQYGNKLDIGIRAPNFLQFIGFPPIVSGALPSVFESFLDLVLSPALLGIAALWLVFKKRKHLLAPRNLPFGLIICGASLLMVYSSFAITSYQSHKIAIQWVPFIYISLLILYANSIRIFKFRSIRDSIFVATSFALIGNIFVWNVFSFGFVGDSESRQLHSISNEMLSVREALARLKLDSVLMDMSSGNSWIPLDRTVAGALVSYPGTLIVSSWKLSGYPFYTGWAVTKSVNTTMTSDRQSESQIFDNGTFSVRHICRVICAPSSLGVSALVAGMPITKNGYEEYWWTFSENLKSPELSIYMEGKPRTKVKVTIFWNKGQGSPESCSEFPISVSTPGYAEINSIGYVRLPVEVPSSGCYHLKSVELNSPSENPTQG